MFESFLPQSHGHNLALTLSCVPCSLDSGVPEWSSPSSSVLLSKLELSNTQVYEPEIGVCTVRQREASLGTTLFLTKCF